MNPIQQELKEILKVFDALCAKHGLRYYANGGTLLGAIRHGGFIPWDDDIDVVMPRPDYNRLMQEVPFPEGYAAVIRPNRFAGAFDNTRIEATHGDEEWDASQPNLGIDVFPVDGTPNNPVLRRIHITRCLAVFAMIKLKRIEHVQRQENLKNRADRPFAEKIFIKYGGILAALLKHIEADTLTDRFLRLSQRYEFDKSDVVGVYCGRHRFNEFFERTVYLGVNRVPFENLLIRTLLNPHAYLQRTYGKDYMVIPPDNRREKHGNMQIWRTDDLERPEEVR